MKTPTKAGEILNEIFAAAGRPFLVPAERRDEFIQDLAACYPDIDRETAMEVVNLICM